MTPKRAAIYVRISKDITGKGLGVERQTDECRALADRLGWGVATVLCDNDISAYSGKRRPDYERLLEGLKEGEFDGVIVWATDRLYRRVSDLLDFITVVEASGAEVLAANSGRIDLSTASGRMNAITLANFSQYESAIKSERLVFQRQQFAAAGKFNGGMRPFGFQKDGVSHHPEEAPALRKAAGEILDGRSINSVAVEHGWSRRTLHRALLSPRMAGLRAHKGEIVGKADWEPIIDRAMWERLKITIGDPARKVSRPARNYLLTGYIWAVDDDGVFLDRMMSRPDNGTRRYIALHPKQRSVTADHVERIVVDALLAEFDNVVVTPGPDDDAAEAMAAEIVRLEGELQQLADLRGQEVISMAEWMTARTPLQAKLDATRKAMPVRRSPRATDLFTEPGALRRAWDEATASGDFSRCREIVTTALDRLGKVVTISAVGQKGSRFDPSRVHFADTP